MCKVYLIYNAFAKLTIIYRLTKGNETKRRECSILQSGLCKWGGGTEKSEHCFPGGCKDPAVCHEVCAECMEVVNVESDGLVVTL